MAQSLSREDILYILANVFRISKEPDNAFKILDDGIHVPDLSTIFQNHIDDTEVHVPSIDTYDILNSLAVDSNGNLTYNGHYLNIVLSDKADNAISIQPDGSLYIKEIPEAVKEHMEDEAIHVTEDDKEVWNTAKEDAVTESNEYTDKEIKKLVIYKTSIVVELPEKGDPTVLYLLKEHKDTPEELGYIPYMYLEDEWNVMGITKKTLDLYALKDEYMPKKDYQNHNNMNALDKIGENDDGCLTYDGKDISLLHISDESGNAIQDKGGRAYVEDLLPLVNSIAVSAAFSKRTLLEKDCTEVGKYELKDTIDNYNLLLIEYYYRPKDETQPCGCAKTILIDPNSALALHERGIDYMLELGYGISVYNTKFFMEKRYLDINYYNDICIWKITGIRKGDEI